MAKLQEGLAKVIAWLACVQFSYHWNTHLPWTGPCTDPTLLYTGPVPMTPSPIRVLDLTMLVPAPTSDTPTSNGNTSAVTKKISKMFFNAAKDYNSARNITTFEEFTKCVDAIIAQGYLPPLGPNQVDYMSCKLTGTAVQALLSCRFLGSHRPS
ncbi:hypothetical protein BDK51DRAFT_26556 [Blyttiomyces helicus]|uniref:Uncharacterized protein n=1 Tax=Blyttiomyces helicus TaxID=388810 RepID=A0A4P9W803_9FUNG|nr:hypothetical protein BDK51DRAFT_26556 [Blyttiomyces helicus]|eukprot:RKO86910.1 hypothetical protein BDK51DRAFT_26556 [Blyttiomyces helicus]